MAELKGNIMKTLIKTAAGLAWGAASAHAFSGDQVAEAVGNVKDARDAFEYGRGHALKMHFTAGAAGQSSECTDIRYSYVGPEEGVARTQKLWDAIGFVHGRVKTGWIRIQKGENGRCIWVVQDPETRRQTRCFTDGKAIEELCLERDEDSGQRGFYMQADVDLEKEIATDPGSQ